MQAIPCAFGSRFFFEEVVVSTYPPGPHYLSSDDYAGDDDIVAPRIGGYPDVDTSGTNNERSAVFVEASCSEAIVSEIARGEVYFAKSAI